MDGSFDGSVSDSALDAFDAQIAILDADARIIRVNEAWRRFGAANGAPDIEWVGWNYHDECARSAAAGEEHAANVAVALAQILRGGIERRMFAYECSSPTEQRFFSMTITAFDHDGERHAAVVHEDVTAHVQRGAMPVGDLDGGHGGGLAAGG